MPALTTLAAFRWLATPAGAEAAAALGPAALADDALLSTSARLRRTYTPDQAAALIALGRARLAAVEKFGAHAAHLLAPREAVEQASSPAVRAWRAAVLAHPGARVVDAGCGIGADSLAFAAAGAAVFGFDLDPARAFCAAHNAAVFAVSDRAHFACADARAPLPVRALGRDSLLFCDPARRDAHGNRTFDHEAYQPPFSHAAAWAQAYPGVRVAVKCAPGLDVAAIARWGGAVVFLSHEGDLKEALWVSDGRDRAGAPLPAAVLFAGGAAHRWARAEGEPPPADVREPRAFLLEPDSAIIRAGLVRQAGAAWNASQLDETIAYLTADAVPETPWMRAWAVEAWMPFSVKGLRAALRARGIGAVTVKKRGSPMTPEALIAALKLRGEGRRAGVVLTRLRGQPIAVIVGEGPVARPA